MFDKFQQMGQQVSQLKKIRDQAVQMQKQLQAEVIEVEENGIRVVMTGDQKVETVTIDGKYEERLVKILNDAIKKSQQVAAKKLQEMSGGLKGLLGGGMS
ncbi:YbaB/EbfC family nucleoid-associated protein [Candidatus Woesebacteria bacterium]|nr:YbaB/EbfC family nucleoid-associated protein [Candidatus Woesebacteria bacterium]